MKRGQQHHPQATNKLKKLIKSINLSLRKVSTYYLSLFFFPKSCTTYLLFPRRSSNTSPLPPVTTCRLPFSVVISFFFSSVLFSLSCISPTLNSLFFPPASLLLPVFAAFYSRLHPLYFSFSLLISSSFFVFILIFISFCRIFLSF